MRIIAGQYRSRRLKAPLPDGTRPTSDKLRETVFNILGASVKGCCFLDGCAGVGAIGIEAISRGAAQVIFVDQSRRATRMIRENLASLEIEEGFRIIELDIMKALERCAAEGMVFDIAFLDPPYDRREIFDRALESLSASPLIAPEGVLILEHSKRMDLPEKAGALRRVRRLAQGDSALAFYRWEAL